jgi:hypothetical protein
LGELVECNEVVAFFSLGLTFRESSVERGAGPDVAEGVFGVGGQRRSSGPNWEEKLKEGRPEECEW